MRARFQHHEECLPTSHGSDSRLTIAYLATPFLKLSNLGHQGSIAKNNGVFQLPNEHVMLPVEGPIIHAFCYFGNQHFHVFSSYSCRSNKLVTEHPPNFIRDNLGGTICVNFRLSSSYSIYLSCTNPATSLMSS